MLTLNELKELRSEKVKEMESIVETRQNNMDEEALSAVKSIKDEISDIDRKIESIEELRSVAQLEAKPEKATQAKKEELRSLWDSYLRGKMTSREYEQRANSVTNNPDIVPEDFLRELFETIDEYGTIYPSVRKITTADNGTISIPMINDTANSGAWLGELDAITKSDFVTSTITLSAYKLATGIQVSTELIEDSFFDISSYIARALGERIARTVENALIFGDGANKPLGIINDTNTVQATTANVGTVEVDDLINLIHTLPPTQRQGAVYLVSDEVMAVLLKAKDADGRPLLQPESGSTQANDVLYRLAGYEVRANYELKTIAPGNEVAIFGNLNNYMVREVRNVNVKRDPYSDMGIDAENFYATMRLDGKVVSANTCFTSLTVASSTTAAKGKK